MKKMTEQERFSLIDHLMDLGCPLDLGQGYRDTPAGLKLTQLPGLGHNEVADLDDGRARYVMHMLISSELNLPVRIRRISLKAPWGTTGRFAAARSFQARPGVSII